MNIIDRFRLAFAAKESRARIVSTISQVGKPVGTPANYEAFANKGYSKNVFVFSAIGKIATACSGIKWELYNKGKNKTEIETHPLLTLLEKPNPMQSLSSFIESVVAYRLISGNSYIEANTGMGKIPLELWPVRPDRMKVIPDSRGYVGAYEFSSGGGKQLWEVDPVSLYSKILHWKTFNPLDNWYGLSPIQAALLSLDQNNQGQMWNLAMLQNSATPSGVLQMKTSDSNPRGELTDEQYKRLKSEFESSYQGAKSAGRPMIIEGGLQWQSISLSPKDMEFVKNKEVTAIDLCLVFGVPGEIMGLGQKTFNNYKEARLSFYEETILPTMDSLRDSLNYWLTPAFGEGIYLDYDKDDIEALVYRREQKYTSLANVNFLTQNEKRAAVGYEEVEGQDVFVIGSQVIDPNAVEEDTTEEDPNATKPNAEQDTDPESETDTDPNEQPQKGIQVETLEWKSFNLINSDEKRKSWENQNRKRRQLADNFRVDLKKDYKRMIVSLSKTAEDLKGRDPKLIEYALLKIIEDDKKYFKTTIEKHLKKTFTIFGQTIFREGKEIGICFETKAPPKFDSFVVHYIEQRTGDAITTITNTNEKKAKQIVKEWVADSITEGESVEDLSKYLEAEFSSITDSQAMRIARTEVSMASNNGTLEAVKSLNISGYEKEWVTANDGRVRDGGPKNDSADHGIMNGATMPIDEKFGVPPDALMDGPGDDSAGADQVINCRCVLVFSNRNKESEI